MGELSCKAGRREEGTRDGEEGQQRKGKIERELSAKGSFFGSICLSALLGRESIFVPGHLS